MEKALKKLYYDVNKPAAYGTVDCLYHATKKKYSRKKIAEFLHSQDTHTLYARARKNFPTRRVETLGLHDTHFADLADMQSYKKDNSGFAYLLTIVGALSKFAWVIPLKNKSAKTVAKAFDKLYSSEPIPFSLATERGGEFVNRDMERVLKRYEVHRYTMRNRQKASIAERFIRTLKAILFKYMHSKQTRKYINDLSKLVAAYNARKHHSIGLAPKDVNYGNVDFVMRKL